LRQVCWFSMAKLSLFSRAVPLWQPQVAVTKGRNDALLRRVIRKYCERWRTVHRSCCCFVSLPADSVELLLLLAIYALHVMEGRGSSRRLGSRGALLGCAGAHRGGASCFPSRTHGFASYGILPRPLLSSSTRRDCLLPRSTIQNPVVSELGGDSVMWGCTISEHGHRSRR